MICVTYIRRNGGFGDQNASVSPTGPPCRARLDLVRSEIMKVLWVPQIKVKTMTHRNGLFFNNEYIEMNVEREFVGCASPSRRVAGNAGSIGKYFLQYQGRRRGGGQVPL